jgi:hypothetical protein
MKDSKPEKNTQKPIDFIFSTLKILQNKTPMPDGFLKKEIYKYPFEILNNLNIEEKQETLNKIKKEYNKYFSEEYEIAKQYWKSMNVISSFLCDEEKKNLLNNEEIMTLLDNYKSEEEMLQIESEIKNNMNSENDDAQFWRNAYELLNYLKHKKLMEDLYNNFINNQRINYKLKIEEKEKNSKENNNIDNKNKKEQEINDNDRYKLLYKDLETIRYNRFMNEDSDENDEDINDDEKTEDDLSPQKYESDSEGELNKIAINQMDYFAKLNASRKKILQNKINEYKENKINEDIMNKNRKKINKLKDKHTTHTKNNKNSLNLEEQEDIDIEEDNKQKANKFLDFIMNQKQKQKEELLEKDDSSSSEKEESDKEALNFLQKIKGHKNKNSYLDQIKDLPLAKYDNDKNKKEEKDEEMEMTEFQKTIQNFDKYLDKNDISGVYTNLEIIENTFRDLEKNSDNELVFNDIVEIKKEYEWSKDYKPIKPRYANKKILGFDWNRHNQAHYDNVNLPPKTVNGYRFNIFYPNLVDKTKTPKFYLQRSETPDMCIIRFESGAPYEDVAFKIINREWNTRQKGDFLNVFDKGVLKLYFKFKRFRYKR